MSKNLPKVPDAKFQEVNGLRYVQEAVEDRSTGLGWIFRTKPVTDIGIDAEMEMVNAESQATGKLISLQIKCGPSYLEEKTNTGYVYRGDREHLTYWLDHSLPVLLVLVDPSNKKCFWVEVTASSAERTRKEWKIEVPFHNLLGGTQRQQMEWIAQRDILGSLVRLNLVRWLYARFFNRMYVLDIFEAPEDFHWWSELACIDGNRMIGVDMILDRYGSFDVEAVKESLSHIHGNQRNASTVGLYLCFVSSSSKAMNISTQIRSLVAAHPNVEIYRFLLRDDHLSEILPNDDLVDGYAQGEPMTFGRTLLNF